MQKREFAIKRDELGALIKKVVRYYSSESSTVVSPEVHGFSTKDGNVKVISVHEHSGWNFTGPLTLTWFFEKLDGDGTKLTLVCLGGKTMLGSSFGRTSASIARVIRTLRKSGFTLIPLN